MYLQQELKIQKAEIMYLQQELKIQKAKKKNIFFYKMNPPPQWCKGVDANLG